MEQLHFITKLLDIKDPNIQILDIINKDTHKEIIAKLDYDAPSCPECGNQLKKYDFQKPSKIPYLETTGMPTRILLRKRRFKCYHCSKMMVAETSIVKKNHQIPRIINQKIAQKLIEKISMTDIAHQLSISTSTVIRKLNDFHFKHDFSCLPEIMSWDEYAFTKGKMSFIAQDFNNLNIITVLEGRTQAIIRNHFLKYDRAVRCRVKIITMDMFSPYYDLARQLFPCAKIVLDRFHIVQHLSRAMSRVRVQIMNQLDRKSHEYKAIKRYWKLIQQDSRKLSDKHFYRPTFRMHLTNKEILDKLLSYSQDLKHHYQLYQLLLFHFQNKEPEKFFGLIEDNLKQVHPIFQTVFKTFLKDKEKVINALQLHYSNAKLEATNNLIKLIKRNAFGFRNFENFKKTDFYRSEHQKRKDEICPFSNLAFLQPTTIDKEPNFDDIRFLVRIFTSFFPKIQCLLSIRIMKDRGLNLDTFFLKTNHFDHRARDFQKKLLKTQDVAVKSLHYLTLRHHENTWNVAEMVYYQYQNQTHEDTESKIPLPSECFLREMDESARFLK
ncbi:IS1167, transposase [Streptococcus pneumoniae]|nr:IS1167, transposase [Streptococcus pneumoniae]